MIFFITTIHIYLLKHIVDSSIQCLFENDATCKLFHLYIKTILVNYNSGHCYLCLYNINKFLKFFQAHFYHPKINLDVLLFLGNFF